MSSFLNVPTYNWKPAVPTAADLPSGGAPGDSCATMDTFQIYIYNGNVWVPIVSASGVNSFTVFQTNSGTYPVADGPNDTLTLTTNSLGFATFVGNAVTDTVTLTFAFTPESTSNKATNLVAPDNIKYPTTLAVSTALSGKQDTLTIGNLTSSDITVTGGTGAVIGAGASLVIANNAVTNAKLAQMPTKTFKGNNTGATANALDLTATQLTAELDVFVGENGTINGTIGLVPAPIVLDGQTKRKFLSADGTFSAQTKYFAPRSEALKVIGTFIGRTTTANQWFDVAYSPQLNLFVAIASSGTNRISVSKDGINWRDIAAPQNSTWTKIIWSPELGIFCAVSFDGASRIMTSPDGLTWTLRTIAAETWYDLTWSAKLSLFCATSLSGGTGIATSPDGITWTSQTASSSTNFYSVTWSPELSIFCTIRLNGAIFTSPDGITWTSQTVSNKSWSSIAWSPELGLFCIVGITGTNRCATSPDGITWTDRAIPACSWRSVTWAAELGMFISLCSGGNLAYSFDGITWTSGTNPQSTNQWYSGIWAKEPGLFVITGITGTNRIMTSTYTRGWENGFNPNSVDLVSTRTGTTLTLNKVDANNTTRFTSATAVTITIPSDTTSPTIRIGDKFTLFQEGTGSLTCVADGGVTIDSVGGALASTSQYEFLLVEKIATNLWTVTKSKTDLATVSYTVDGKVTSTQYSQLEYEFAHDLTVSTYFKQFIYTGPDLTTINIWTTPGMTLKKYQKDFTYTLGDLTSIVITRIIDSATQTKTFTYTLGNLTSISVA